MLRAPQSTRFSLSAMPNLEQSGTVLELRPIAAAFQAECVPEGSVWNSAGLPLASNPTTRVDMPKGRMPPLCVYFCWMLAIHLVRYSTCGTPSCQERCFTPCHMPIDW